EAPREDVEMKEAPVPPKVSGTAEEPLSSESSSNKAEKSVEDGAVVQNGIKPTAISDEVEMKDAAPTGAGQLAKPTPPSTDIEMTEAETDNGKANLPLVDTSESA